MRLPVLLGAALWLGAAWLAWPSGEEAHHASSASSDSASVPVPAPVSGHDARDIATTAHMPAAAHAAAVRLAQQLVFTEEEGIVSAVDINGMGASPFWPGAAAVAEPLYPGPDAGWIPDPAWPDSPARRGEPG